MGRETEERKTYITETEMLGCIKFDSYSNTISCWQTITVILKKDESYFLNLILK